VTLNPETFQLVLKTFSQALREDPDPQARAKAAQCLGQLGSTDALPILCAAVRQEQSPEVKVQIMDAIVDLAQSQPASPMSESPKYDLRGANIGNFAETIQPGGRQEATQHIYAPEQNFDRLLADYKQFFNDLQQRYPAQVPDSALPAIIEAEFRDIQTKQPQRWQNFLSLKHLWHGSKKAAFAIGEHFAEDSPWGKGALAFLKGVTEDMD
jgi:thioredoxin-like negative regulator of GroEL